MEIRREPVFESEPRKTAPTLAEFAKKAQITEDKVWELIEEGQLSARFVNDAILILQDQPSVNCPDQAADAFQQPEVATPAAQLEALEKPVKAPVRERDRPFQEYKAPIAPKGKMQADEINESSSDFMIFAQDALSRTTELSKELLATKNEMIRLKDEHIAFLNDLLQQKDKELRSLNRKVEELATLNNFELR